ncbi:MAG: FecR domain-containing protein [Bryobacterales bacterium]|nr:FecR domain-containing protein [Bryobacterales bacterium]
MRRSRTHLWLAAAVVLFWAPAARAQDEEEAPERGVARVSVLNGEVSVRRGDSGDWVAASVNAPLVVEDRVSTGPASRAEVQFDYANMIRLAADTEIRLSGLEYRRYQVQVARGTVTFRVLRDSEADVEVSTPSVSVRPQKKGAYRVAVREDGQTEITVRSGEVEVYTPRGVERLRSGRTMLVRGGASDPEFQMVRAMEEDDFDRWNERRDRDLTRSRSYRYVHRDVYGAEDLDSYGTWIYVPPYGWVWKPYAAPDWAPYRLGRWTWLDWYGWTWASYDPWGWAPYHYGRWFHHGGNWCWWPGAYHHPRYYWRPGLVAFFGWGSYSGLHVGIGFGNVGWVPLAPYEPYYPWYGRRYYGGFRNHTYIDNSVHITNINIHNSYRNARIRNGITGVGADDFVTGRSGRFAGYDSTRLERASLVRGALPVTPGRESLRYSDREVRRASLPRDSGEGRFYSRRTPTQVNRVPFEDQRRGMEQIARRASSVDPGGQAGGEARGALPRGESGRVQRSAEAQGQESGGWRRLGEPRERSQGNAGQGAGGAENRIGRSQDRVVSGGNARGEAAGGDAGWRRFGEPAGRVGRSDAQTGSRRSGTEGGTNQDWRRQGSGSEGRVTASPERGATRQQSGQDADRSWRRFGEPGGRGATGGAGRQEGTVNRAPVDRGEGGRATGRQSTGTWQRFDSGSSGSQWDRSSAGSRQESIRINPPIVRERSGSRERTPDNSWSSGGRVSRGDTGGAWSAPRSERSVGGSSEGGGRVSRGDTGGSWSAPRMERNSASPSWGGGGRTSRGDSGGSWSGRSSGGGGGSVYRGGGSGGRVSGGGASGGGGVSRGGGGSRGGGRNR